ncbi:hypothetical protein P9139_20200 [Curtobacterium flaccumfaciens]|nr:hypothetical protein P9139_20200 [Curtobacterium flaccumfaciens]
MQRIARSAAFGAAVLLTAGLVGTIGAGPAEAAAPTGGVLQILSPHYSDRGTPQFADGSNVQRYLSDTTRGIDARMTVSSTSSASFILTPPDDKPLTTGVYRLVGQQPYGAKVPTLAINGEYMYGEFDIVDIASDPTNGTITRFDGVVPGVGECRFGRTPPDLWSSELGTSSSRRRSSDCRRRCRSRRCTTPVPRLSRSARLQSSG